ncbi:MAG: DUF2946 family protein [Parvibaculum sp.]|uniref:DUF2946 family protein n=1 Tax=Parvibaculum sp. TaxID=2024848 RepID=UPI0032679267
MGTISTYRGDIQGLRARIGAVQSLAFLAIFLHIAVPFALQLAGPATEGLFQTIICSGGEAKAVYLDAEGNPVEPAAPGTSSHDCTSCLHHCGAAALTAIFALPALHWTLPAPARAAHMVLAPVFTADGHPRAPPL